MDQIMIPIALIITFALSLASSSAFSADVEAELEKCRASSDSATRLACFDALGKTSKGDDADVSSTAALPMEEAQAIPMKSGEVVQAVAKEPDSDSAMQDFGLEQQKAIEDVPESMESMVTEVHRGRYTKPTVTPENGQIWQQTDVGRMQLKTGQMAVISRGTLGSFFIKNKSGGSRARVRRIK